MFTTEQIIEKLQTSPTKSDFDIIIDNFPDHKAGPVVKIAVNETMYPELVRMLGAEVSDEGYEYRGILLVPIAEPTWIKYRFEVEDYEKYLGGNNTNDGKLVVGYAKE